MPLKYSYCQRHYSLEIMETDLDYSKHKTQYLTLLNDVNNIICFKGFCEICRESCVTFVVGQAKILFLF